MKKIIYFRITGLLSAFALVLSSFSQYSGLMNLNKSALASSARRMDSMSTREEADKVIIESLRSINMKIYNDFTKSFKNATGIGVHQTDKNTFIAFTENGARERVCYNTRGKRTYSVKYYGIDKVPPDVLEIVQGEFPRFSLLRGAEVTVNGKTAYLVDIEDSHSFKTIRVVEGSYDIYSSYIKQK